MRRPRRRGPDQLSDVTVRCNRSEFRLLPTTERTSILGFWFAKAQQKFSGIRIHALCALSNHFHLVVRDRDGQLSDFMQYVLGNAARRINYLDRVRGAVFEDRFAEIEIVDTPAFVRRIAYAVCNPVEAKLVRSHHEWKGLCLYSGKEPTTHRFTVFHEAAHQRALREAERTGAHVDENSFFDTAELEIAQLDEGLAAEVHAAVVARENELRAVKFAVFGMRRVLQFSPFDRPGMSARSRRPLCFASTREAWHAFADGWYAFVSTFREASKAFRAGQLDTVFPRFSFRPISSAG
jgi:putative transposase